MLFVASRSLQSSTSLITGVILSQIPLGISTSLYEEPCVPFIWCLSTFLLLYWRTTLTCKNIRATSSPSILSTVSAALDVHVVAVVL